MLIIKNILIILRFIPLIIGFKRNNMLLMEDIKRWKDILHLDGGDYYTIAKLLWEKKEFRNLFIYRNSNRLIYRSLIKILYKPIDSLYIETEEIGGGLFIQHGFSTMISAKSIGKNCWVNQQVTIGYKGNESPPIIGNDVMITCGAKVLGNIVVGNNSIIGANAVVIKDVEENSVMVGIPAKRIK